MDNKPIGTFIFKYRTLGKFQYVALVELTERLTIHRSIEANAHHTTVAFAAASRTASTGEPHRG